MDERCTIVGEDTDGKMQVVALRICNSSVKMPELIREPLQIKYKPLVTTNCCCVRAGDKIR
jgi:hypothetical protein